MLVLSAIYKHLRSTTEIGFFIPAAKVAIFSNSDKFHTFVRCRLHTTLTSIFLHEIHLQVLCFFVSVMDAIEKEVEREAVRNSVNVVSEVFMRQFKKDANVKLKESFEFEDVRAVKPLKKALLLPISHLIQKIKSMICLSDRK